MQPSESVKGLIRELARRRVFLFFSVLLVLALFNAIFEEADTFLHALDDYAIVSISIVVVAFIALSWNKQSLEALRRQHTIIVGLFLLALGFQIFAFVQEINDPPDFGNEIPSLTLLALVFANRFV